MKRLGRYAAIVSLCISVPVFAQDMPGMTMDHSPVDHAPMDHFKMGHGPIPANGAAGTDLPSGNAPAPPPPTDRYADRIFPAQEMERSHRQMMAENGEQTFSFVMFNLAEYQPRRGSDGFRWDGEGWYGGDINRLTIKTEGEGQFGRGVEEAEIQALYSRAIDPYFNAQIGVRQDLGRGPKRTYATLGLEGLAPYWFDVEGAVFLSDKGDVLARLEGYYDQRITQRLVLQPRAELNLAAQDVPASRIGSGLSSVELGLRLRYEFQRQFAPYVGVSWERKIGQTGRYARVDGEHSTSKGLVAGIRFWF
jgi:copper resistance protein B